MKIIRSYTNPILREIQPVITMGTFDGIHLGHQMILGEVIKKSRQLNKNSAVLTYDPIPPVILSPLTFPGLLTTIEEKIAILRNSGVDYLIILPFNKKFAEMDAEKFVEKILIGGIGISHIIVGYDHTFGKSGLGNIHLLKEVGKNREFGVEAINCVSQDNELIKSTIIRDFVINGELQKVARMLGRFYSFSGKVIQGADRGKRIGFPTANLELDNPMKLLPNEGVYAVMVYQDEQPFYGTLFIGPCKTFGENERAIEVNIMGYDGDLYSTELTLLIVKRLRDVIHFDSEDSLKMQIEQDVEMSRNFLKTTKVYCFNQGEVYGRN